MVYNIEKHLMKDCPNFLRLIGIAFCCVAVGILLTSTSIFIFNKWIDAHSDVSSPNLVANFGSLVFGVIALVF